MRRLIVDPLLRACRALVVDPILGALAPLLSHLEGRLDNVVANEGELMQNLTRLKDEVRETRGLVASAVALLAGLANALREHAGDEAAILEIANDLDQDNNALAAAITANSAGAPVPGTVPVEPPLSGEPLSPGAPPPDGTIAPPGENAGTVSEGLGDPAGPALVEETTGNPSPFETAQPSPSSEPLDVPGVTEGLDVPAVAPSEPVVASTEAEVSGSDFERRTRRR